MKTYGCVEMKLDKEPFEKIKSGAKTIELRLYDEKRRKIRVGDIIVFTCRNGGERLAMRVKALHVLADFRELYSSLDLLKCGYTPANVRAAKPGDMEKYYSAAEQAEYGVVGIELDRL